DLAFLQPHVVFDLALADDGLVDSAQVDFAGDRGNIDHDLQTDFTVQVNARRNVNVHADVLILELGVHQRVDDTRGAGGAQAGLEAAGGHGDAVADLQFGRLSIHHADFGVVNDLCGRVGEQGHGGSARQGNAEVGAGEAMELLEGEGGDGGAGGAGGGTGGVRGRKGQHNARSWGDAQLARTVAARLQNGHLDNHFGSGAVHVAQDFLDHGQLVGRVADDDGVLACDLLDVVQVGNTADPRHDFVQFLRLYGI